VIRLFKLGFSLVLLLVLLVVADRLAARVAGQVVADRIKASQHLTTTPKVTVEGFPFLTQLWKGDYDQVDASAVDIAREDVRASSLTLHLHGVHVSVGDVVSQSVKAIPVDRADGTVTLSYADVNALVAASGVTVDAADAGKVKVTGTVTVLGRKVHASGLGTLAADPAGIKVTVSDVKAAGLTPAVTSLLAQKLSFVIPTSSLPYGVKVESVTADSTGVTVSAALSAFTIPVQ
jgi:DUF2993 family protein